MIELLIVMSILIVLVSLALPPVLRARIQSNEAAAMGNLRTVGSATEGFRSAQEPPVYPDSFNTMMTSNSPYLDSSWATGRRQGYDYLFNGSADGSTYSTAGAPQIQNVSGINSYCVDQTGVIRRYASGSVPGGPPGCNPNGVPI